MSAPPHVRLVHGLGGTAATMAPLAAALTAAGIACECITLPGHGTDPHDLERIGWTEWLAAVTPAPVLVGQSMGAALALARASLDHRVGAVVAVNMPAPDLDALDGLDRLRRQGHDRLDAPPLAEGELGYTHLPIAAAEEMVRGIASIDLGAVRAATLLVTGALDDVVDPYAAELVAPMLGGPVDRLVLAHSGHVATLGPDLDTLAAAVIALATHT